VHAGLLDVFHDPADEYLAGVVADCVDVDLDGVVEEAVDEHRPIRRQPTLAAQRASRCSPAVHRDDLVQRRHELVGVVDDAHRPATKHVARPHEHGVADTISDGERLLEIDSRAAGRLWNR